MLPRVLEVEAMDTPEEADDYDRMDFSEVNARFVADFLAAHGPCRGGLILDVGTGPARIPIALCRADPAARVLGVDLAWAMIERAGRNVAGAGLGGRIRLEAGDAKALAPTGDGDGDGFEAVLSNTIVHHVPEPGPALAGMARAVAPGGTLFVRDLCRPDDQATLDRLVEAHAGGEPAEARALFAASLHAALTPAEARALVAGLGLPADGIAMTSDRHWTWRWRRPAG